MRLAIWRSLDIGAGQALTAALGGSRLPDGWLGDSDFGVNQVYENAAVGASTGLRYFIASQLPVTYSITTQSTSGAFQIDASTGVVTVSTAGLLDANTRPIETVLLRAVYYLYLYTNGDQAYSNGDPLVDDQVVEQEFTINILAA